MYPNLVCASNNIEFYFLANMSNLRLVFNFCWICHPIFLIAFNYLLLYFNLTWFWDNFISLFDRVVLVSIYTQTLNILQETCKRYGYSYTRLDGNTPVSQRQQIVDSFNCKFSPAFIFLLSSKAGGVGLNLVGASHLILYDIDWNPATDIQVWYNCVLWVVTGIKWAPDWFWDVWINMSYCYPAITLCLDTKENSEKKKNWSVVNV